MLTEFYTRSGKTNLVQHPKLSFVYSYGNKQICIEHLNPPGMNKGSMRQHVEGKAHKRNYDTGEPIMEQGIPKEILAQLKLQKQESKVESKQDNFDELKRKLEFMFPDNPEDVKDLLSRYGFEGTIKYDIQSKIDGHKRDKMDDARAIVMMHLMEQNPSMFLQCLKSHLSTLTKTAESRHELPSKTPILLPKPSQNR